MIFKAQHIKLIQQGLKTQTRRLKRPRVVVGRTYSLNTRFYKRENHGRIRATKLYERPLGQVTPADANNLGYASREAYLEALRTIHGHELDLNASVWVLEFEYCG
jgi:hypothetical protein